MSIIQVLDPFVSNQIAAGEVVERPSSVVKELIENCIDAGATAVTVEIVDGGLTSIKVTDNGCGMEYEDAKCAFLRHATSKIRTADDLTTISTLGFRGEALAAIASVSRIQMWTRPKQAAFGTKIQMDGGELILDEPFGAPEGTSITVSDLFFNTPARKKFMKRPHVEAGYVQEVMLRAILARPDIAFRFVSQGRTVFLASGDGNLENALLCVYGKEVRGLLRPVKGSIPGGTFEGFIGDITLSRTNRKREHIAINGRPVNCFAISLAVESAFDTQLMVHKFPLFALSITIPNDAVDVNVHPAKLEVRLRDESGIAQALTSAIAPVVMRQENPFAHLYREPQKQQTSPRVTSEMLFSSAKPAESKPAPTVAKTRSTLVARETAPSVLSTPKYTPAPVQTSTTAKPSASVKSTLQKSAPPIAAQKKAEPVKPVVSFEKPSVPIVTEQKKEEQITSAPAAAPVQMPVPVPAVKKEAPVQSEGFFAELPKEEMPARISYRLIGQLFSTYLMLEVEKKLLVIDQHAAHERLLFDKYCAQVDAGDVIKQPLLVPHVVDLSADEMSILMDHREFMDQMGFEIEEFGPLTVMVRSVPMILGQAQMADFLHETLAQVDKRASVQTSTLKHSQVATIACKAAIKAGDPLTSEEIEQLLDLVRQHQGALTCPHGRPIFFEMTKYEIEKRFKRV